MNHFLPSGDYLPHDAPMLLLEEVVSATDEAATCHVIVSVNSVLAPFLDPDDNLLGWFTLELVAQTIGIWPGWHHQQQDQASITLGMVLGMRELVCATGVLSAGERLSIHVKPLVQNVRFDNSECAIRADNEMLATGRINTFQLTPEETNTLFQRGAST